MKHSDPYKKAFYGLQFTKKSYQAEFLQLASDVVSSL